MCVLLTWSVGERGAYGGGSEEHRAQHITSIITDLSAAGLPAKLKHITQRRKRKQP